MGDSVAPRTGLMLGATIAIVPPKPSTLELALISLVASFQGLSSIPNTASALTFMLSPLPAAALAIISLLP